MFWGYKSNKRILQLELDAEKRKEDLKETKEAINEMREIMTLISQVLITEKKIFYFFCDKCSGKFLSKRKQRFCDKCSRNKMNGK